MSDEKKIAHEITNVSIVDEMKDSYLRFAMSVIISRALPDVRDGLKPSQRRVLFAMNELNLNPGRQYAQMRGHRRGVHGQIPPAWRRLHLRHAGAHGAGLELALSAGASQGNFGSMDGDPPAAMRYTEAKLTPLGAELLADIEQDTVDFIPNFDETTQEPTVLPAAFPNLICNGTSGIAVGMATEIAPHNLGEVIDACALLIDRDYDITIDELLQVMPGPDFPTGGLVLGTGGIREAFATGRGAVHHAGAHASSNRRRTAKPPSSSPSCPTR